MQKLFDSVLVTDTPKSMSNEQLQAILKDFDSYKLSITLYLKDYFTSHGVDHYSVFIHMPYGDIFLLKASLTNIQYEETIYLPFMACDIKLWKHLVDNPDNPLFNLLRLFEKYTNDILSLTKDILVNQPITNKFMQDHKILDILNLHEYVRIYQDFSSFIE